MNFLQRLRYSMVVPDQAEEKPLPEHSAEELEAESATLSERERAIGLLAGPVAAVIGLLISSASINYAKSHHQGYATYQELTYVMLGMSVLILVTAMLRKRLFLGMATALYGLAVFNLHYWGFGVPFILVGAWYLVRAYRLQQGLRRATGGGPSARPRGNAPGSGSRPRRNKRYTPPT